MGFKGANLMHYVVYRAADGWRWRLVAGNGEIVSQGEAYASKWNAKRACRRLQPGTPIREENE